MEVLMITKNSEREHGGRGADTGLNSWVWEVQDWEIMISSGTNKHDCIIQDEIMLHCMI